MTFDPIAATFQLIFIINTDIRQPTIVYLNEDLNMNQIDHTQKVTENIPSGVSIESASYMENNNLEN